MKNLLLLFVALFCLSQAFAQSGTLEADNGVIVGNNTGTAAGTVRWTGTDFEGYDGTQWLSLTGNGVIGTLLQDDDGDTKIELTETGGDAIRMTVSGSEVIKIDTNDYRSVMVEMPNSNYSQSLFIGSGAGEHNGQNAVAGVQGNSNTGVGFHALHSNEKAAGNTAFGAQALQDYFGTGGDNTAVGSAAMANTTTGGANTSIGRIASYSNETGSSNVSLGYAALYANVDGHSNVALGRSSGSKDTSGSSNVYVGYLSGSSNSPGGSHGKSNNVMIGYEAGRDCFTNSNVMMGYKAGANESKSNTLYIENSNADSSEALIYGEFNNDFLRVNGELNIVENSGSSAPQLRLSETGADGARLILDNDQTDNYWTIFGRPYNGSSNSQINFHYADVTNGGVQTGNKFRIYGDGDAFLYHSSNGATGAGLRLLNGDNNSQYWRLYTAEGSGDLRFYSDDNSSNARAWINDATGAYSSASDERLKKDISTLSSVLSKVLLLSPKRYLYTEQEPGDAKSIGFLAQDAMQLFPECVDYQEGADQYGINYAGFSVVAIKAIQELKAEVDNQSQLLEKQQNQIDQLLKLVKKMTED